MLLLKLPEDVLMTVFISCAYNTHKQLRLTCKDLKELVDIYLHKLDRINTPEKLVCRVLNGPYLCLEKMNCFAMNLLKTKFTKALEISAAYDCQLTLATFKSNLPSKRLAVGLLKGNLLAVFGFGPSSHKIAGISDVVPVEERVMGGLYFLARHLKCHVQCHQNAAARILGLMLDAVTPASLCPEFMEVAQQCVAQSIFFRDVSHLVTANFTLGADQKYLMSPKCMFAMSETMLKTEGTTNTKMRGAAAVAMTKLIMARNNIKHDESIAFLSPYSAHNFKGSGFDLDVYNFRTRLGDSLLLVHMRQSDLPMPTNSFLSEVVSRKRVCNLVYLATPAASTDKYFCVLSDVVVFNVSLIEKVGTLLLEQIKE